MAAPRAIFMAVLIAALGAYAFDCFAASTPDEAMQCCDGMPCPEHTHGDSQDCCRSMPSLHAPFVKSHSFDSASPDFVALAMLPGTVLLPRSDSSARIALAVNSHAPPDAPGAASTPLRV